MLLVQEYLKLGKSLEDLYSEHGVYSYVQNGKISLSYDQLAARESDLLSQQCRGLILRDGSFEIVAAPMFRFFNQGQGGAAEIDFSSAVFEEKLDGTLIIIYFDEIAQRWYCATRSRAEADVAIDGGNLNFSMLAGITLDKMFPGQHIKSVDDFMKTKPVELRQKTFCLELCSPVNRIVCEYNDFSLTLLSVRDLSSLKEEDPQKYSAILGLPTIKTYNFSSLSDLLLVVKNWNPKEHEGVVVKDANFNRIKVKSAAYVAYNRIRDSLSTSHRGCVEIILLEKDDDIISMIPEFIANRIAHYKSAIAKVLTQTQKDFEDLERIQDMKVFAQAAGKKLWPAALFALKRRKTPSLKAWACGNNKSENAIPQSSIDTMIDLCNKVDPSLKKVL